MLHITTGESRLHFHDIFLFRSCNKRFPSVCHLFHISVCFFWFNNSFCIRSPQVTIFGNDAGAGNIYVLMASKLSNNLFHRAWLGSATPVSTKTVAEASIDNEGFLRNTECFNATCLRSLTAKKVTMSLPWYDFPSWSIENLFDLPKPKEKFGALVVVDGEYMTGVNLITAQHAQMNRF